MRTEDECGKRIREIRKTLNLNQKEFSEKVSISPTSLSEIERGKFKPGFEFLVNLAQALNVNLYYVLFDKGDMFLNPATSIYQSKKKYAVNSDDIQKFLYYFERSSIFQYEIMSFFKTKLLKDKELFQDEIEQEKNKLNHEI